MQLLESENTTLRRELDLSIMPKASSRAYASAVKIDASTGRVAVEHLSCDTADTSTCFRSICVNFLESGVFFISDCNKFGEVY